MHRVALVVGLIGCATGGSGDEAAYVDPGLSPAEKADTWRTTVKDYASTCSTAGIAALSDQIAQEIMCESPGALVPFDPTDTITITGNAVLRYMAPDALADLQSVAQGTTIEINSAYRTIAQQYLLYHWWDASRCGVSLAAQPGASNHESGRALDLADWPSDITAMAQNGWAHDVPGDSVHFDHASSQSIQGADVLAFQRLWNRNHQDDIIAEDGAYGPETDARIARAPASGFAIGACM
jgi:hypothetical protein